MVKKYWSKIESFFELSFSIAKAEFKMRNEGSYLGVFWYLLNPLFMFALLFFVFSRKLGYHIKDYPAYLFLGIILFNIFQRTTIDSSNIIIRNSSLLKSIKFSKEALVFANILKNLFSHLFELGLFIILLLVLKIPLLGLIPYALVLFVFSIFIYGTSLILSALTPYIVDLENVWLFLSRIIWLATPIFYSIEGTRIAYINFFNPIYYFITIARDIMVYTKIPEPWLIFGSLFWALLSLVIGLLIFNKLKVKFAELI